MKRTVFFQTDNSDFAKEFKEGFFSSSENWIESDQHNLRIVVSFEAQNEAQRSGKISESVPFCVFVNSTNVEASPGLWSYFEEKQINKISYIFYPDENTKYICSIYDNGELINSKTLMENIMEDVGTQTHPYAIGFQFGVHLASVMDVEPEVKT